MSDKDPKLWESTFGDDSNSDEPEQLSRVRQKKNRHGNKLLVWSLFIILLVVMFLPIIGQKLTSNHNKSAIDSVNQETVSTKPKKDVTKHKTKHKTKNKQKAKKVVSKMDQSQKTDRASANSQPSSQETNSDSAASNQTQTNSNTGSVQQSQSAAANNNVTSNEAQNSASTNGQYYTVQPHDNAYRIALNHGLTTARLYQLNGISNGTVLRPGMQLRVK